MFEDKNLIITKLRDGLYLFDENRESTGYLVIGEDKALMIDTMTGYHDYYVKIREITDKPVMLVNTHGHPDHIYGNIYFEKAYMNNADFEVAQQHIHNPEFEKVCEELGLKMPPFENISEGDVIDLGGKTLNVYNLPGHTPGGIVLLLNEERVLFVGDSINHHLWMQLPESLPIYKLVENIERLMFLEDKADYILHGHAVGFEDISLMRSLLEGARDLVNGRTENDTEYKWFMGTDMQHSFEIKPGIKFNQDDHVICYKKQ